MKKLLVILFVLIGYISFAQGPPIVNRSSSAVTVSDARLRAQLNFYLPRTHGLTLNGGLDTLGAMIYEDSSQHVWYRDTIISGGHKWTMLPTLVNIQQPLQFQNQGINIGPIGGAGIINFLGAGVTAAYSGGTVIVSITSSAGGGVLSINGDTTHNAVFINGYSGTSPNIVTSHGITTWNIPIENGSDTGLITPALYATWNGKQNALTIGNATSSTLTLTGNTGSIIGTGMTVNLANILSAGSCTNCNITLDQYGRVTAYANGSVPAGTVTSVGLTAPSFLTVSNSPITSSGNIVLTLANQAANSIFGNNTGSSAAPTFFVPTSATLDNWFGQTIGTLNSFSSGALNPLFGTMVATGAGGVVSQSFILDSANGYNIFGVSTSGRNLPGYFAPNSTVLNYWFGSTIQAQMSIGAINGGTLNANGASISGASLYLQTPNSSGPGLMSYREHTFLDSLYEGLYSSTTYVDLLGAGIATLRGNSDTLYSKTLVAGTNITLVLNPDSSITINSTASGGGNGIGRDSVETDTTSAGGSLTVTNGYNVLNVQPSSTIGSLTITLPTTWHTSNNLIIAFPVQGVFTQGATVVTSLTIVNGSGQILSQSITPLTASAGEVIVYHLISTYDQRTN